MVKLLYHIPSGDKIILNDKKIVLKSGIDAILKTIEPEDAEAIIFFTKQVAVEAGFIILKITK